MNLFSVNCIVMGILISITTGLLKSDKFGQWQPQQYSTVFRLDSPKFYKNINLSDASFESAKSKQREVHGFGRQIVTQVNVNGQLFSFTNLLTLWAYIQVWLFRRICAWKNYFGSVCASSATSTTGPRYIVGTQKLRWMEAHLYCKEMGYDLTTIESKAEWDHLLNLISTSGLPYGDGFWTSGNDVHREGSFTWLSNAKPVTTWYPIVNPPTGQPDNCCGGEDCVVIWPATLNNVPEYVMNDIDCEAETYFICKQG